MYPASTADVTLPTVGKGMLRRLLLLPSLSADARAVIYEPADGRLSDAPPLSAALAAARFLVEVRGLPLDECEIEISEKVYRIIFSENDGKCEILMDKCKYKLSKTQVFCRGVDLSLENFSDGFSEILLLRCEDEGRVDDEALQAISLSIPDGPRTVAAVRRSEGELFVRCFSPSDESGEAVRCAVAAVLSTAVGAGVAVHISSAAGPARTLRLRRCRGTLAVSCPDDPPPRRIYALDDC